MTFKKVKICSPQDITQFHGPQHHTMCLYSQYISSITLPQRILLIKYLTSSPHSAATCPSNFYGSYLPHFMVVYDAVG